MQYVRKTYRLKSGSKTLDLGKQTHIMGVINCTPDSFSDGDVYNTTIKSLRKCLEMVKHGVSVIDIGGESTRPGADPVSVEEEMSRVVPVIKALRKKTDVWISIDTYKAAVAREAIDSGADIINDISGLQNDKGMPVFAAENKVPVIVMHIAGTPKDMQSNPVYQDVIEDILIYFKERMTSLAKAGISSDCIMLDPGIGFGKTVEHNLTILNNLQVFAKLDRPILVGPSRKSFIGKLLDLPVNERLEGTAAAVALSIAHGAHMVRVHDVSEMQRVSSVTDAILAEQPLDVTE